MDSNVDTVYASEASATPELEIAQDLAKRALPLAPVALLFGTAFWGANGAASAAIGLALCVLNLLVAARIITVSLRISANTLMAAVLGGFLVRFLVLTVAVVGLRHLSFIEDIPLLFTVLVSHLVLLAWETRYVSMSFTYPGLKPRAASKEARTS